jgi:hypothetical protein
MSGTPSHRDRPSYDGHLDLDDIDLATSLEVVGDDEPRLADLIAARLESAGLTPWLRRHRLVLAATAAVVVLALLSGEVLWLRRPMPLPDVPRVLVKVSGPDPTAVVQTESGTGRPVGVVQDLSLTSAERTGVRVEVALVGPGIAAADRPDSYVTIDRSQPDAVVDVHAALDCATPESTTAVAGARPDDFGVLVRRTAPEGEVRIDRVPVIGALALVGAVRTGCLQLAADRDLTASDASVSPVPAAVAATLDVTVTNSSPRRWVGLRVSLGASPQVVSAGPAADLEPGDTGHLLVRVWPDDCADPARALEDGLAVRPELGPDGNPDSGSLPTPTVLLRLPETTRDAVVRAMAASCGTDVPRLTVDDARLRSGAQGGSAGTIDLTASVEAAGARRLEAEAIGSLVVGRLAALAFPVPVRDGTARLDLRWELPGCDAVLRAGRPQLSVTLVGEQHRPYLLDLRGDGVRAVLSSLCGDEVAAVVS